jgi:class 3 adenylate cyclase
MRHALTDSYNQRPKGYFELLQWSLFDMSSPYTLSLLAKLLRLLEIAAMLIALFFLLALGLGYLKDIALFFEITDLENYGAYAYVHYLLVIDSQCINFVRELIPIKLAGYDTARGISVLLAIVVSWAISSLRSHLATKAISRQYSTDVPMGTKVHTTVSAVKSRVQLLEVVQEAKSRLDAIKDVSSSAESKENRARLLTVMAEAQSRLNEMQRDLAFLSIDVVGSTKMKVGEDKTKIEIDFRNYKKFINTAISKGGALTAAWTPDGVMICFSSVDAAVTTAKFVITGLRHFNKDVKTILAEFQVRCGINSGRVYYDPSIPMEEMSDRVIDVAGHMQKYAAADTIFLSKQVVNLLAHLPREGFSPANTNVDGFEAYKWVSY